MLQDNESIMIKASRSSPAATLATSSDPERATRDIGRSAVQLLLVLTVFLLAGCATRPGSDSLVPAAVSAPGAKLVTVFVATNRLPDGVGYGSGRAAELRYEELTISIPPGHRPGNIEWSQERQQDPAVSFVTVRRQRLDETGFRQRITSRAKDGGHVGVFVHGYNYSLQEAVFRLAQLGADIGDVTVPILFSWPSEAAVAGYVADRDAVTYSRDHLAHVLRTLSRIRSNERVTLVGHSMGAWLVMETLRQLRLEERDEVIKRFQVGLAAPDIDADVFRAQVSVVGPLSPPLTVLVSTDDRALAVSSRLAGDRPRVGGLNVADPLMQEVARREGIRFVDISSVEASDGFNHDRFVQFALRSGVTAQGGANSLQQAGAFVFNAAGAVVSSPFTLAGRALAGQ
jgi:esterase/lipase superfamily enzyme